LNLGLFLHFKRHKNLRLDTVQRKAQIGCDEILLIFQVADASRVDLAVE
jgi:hypothetical protein